MMAIVFKVILPVVIVCLALSGCTTVATVGGVAVAVKTGVDKTYETYASYCTAANAVQDRLQDLLDAKAASSTSKIWATASHLLDRLSAAGSAACSDAVAKPSASVVNELTLAIDAVKAFEAAK